MQDHALGASVIPLSISNVDSFVEDQIDLIKLFWEVLQLNYDFFGSVSGLTVNSLKDQVIKQ